jgi:hypothetical protein
MMPSERHHEDHVTRPEHSDLKNRVDKLESKLDRITILVIATLATAIVDIFVKAHP